MNRARTDNPFVNPMFRCRRFAFQSLAVIFVLVILGADSLLAQIIIWGATTAFVISVLACWYFVFRAGQRNGGVGYAMGHLFVTVILTPIVLLGVILMPLLIRGDAERMAAK